MTILLICCLSLIGVLCLIINGMHTKMSNPSHPSSGPSTTPTLLEYGELVESLEMQNRVLQNKLLKKDMKDLVAKMDKFNTEDEVELLREENKNLMNNPPIKFEREIARLSNDNKRLCNVNQNLRNELQDAKKKIGVGSIGLQDNIGQVEQLKKQLKASEDACRIANLMMLDWKERAEKKEIKLSREESLCFCHNLGFIGGQDLINIEDDIVRALNMALKGHFDEVNPPYEVLGDDYSPFGLDFQDELMGDEDWEEPAIEVISNRLIGDDCVATKDSVIEGIKSIVTKSLGWDTSKVQLDELGLQVYGYKGEDTNHILNYTLDHREAYGRVSHLGLSLEELNTIHSVMEVVKGKELYW